MLKVIEFMLFSIGIGLPSSALANKEFRVLLGTTEKAPYAESAPADVLATFNSAVLGTLLRVDENFLLLPNLISKWKWDQTTSSYRLTLRNDIHFHNGRQANAYDLEFALLRGFFSKHRSFYTIFIQGIKGLEDSVKHDTFRSGLVSGVTVIDDHTLQVKLDSPNPALLFSLAHPYFSLVAKEAIATNNITWKSTPVGAGPYKVVEPFANGKVVVERVAPAKNLVNRVAFYTKREKEHFDVSLWEIKGPYKKQYSKLSMGVLSLFFSNAHPLGTNLHFRKAVQHAIDRSTLSTRKKKFIPTVELLPALFWGRPNLADSLDLALAKKELSQVPQKLLKDPIEILAFGGKHISPERIEILDSIVKQLEALGLRVRFRATTDKFLSRENAESAPLELAGRICDYIDPLIMFESFRRNSPFKYTKIDPPDPDFETRFMTARLESGDSQRKTKIRELSRFLNEKAFAIPLLEDKRIFYVNLNSIESLGNQFDALYLNLDQIRIKSTKKPS